MRVWVDDVRPMPEGFDVHIKSLDALVVFLQVIIKAGCDEAIDHISFDHDMPPTIELEESGIYNVHDAIKFYLREDVMHFGKYTISKYLTRWQVHSMNPVGKNNIQCLLRDLGRVRDTG